MSNRVNEYGVNIENLKILRDNLIKDKYLINEVFCEDHTTWRFLFGSEWSNNIDEAIARIDYVINNGEAPDKWGFKDKFAN